MTTAIVLSGGANLGAVHVGMLRALIERDDTVPDMIVGTSVGAVNGAYIASRWNRDGVDGLDELWSNIRRSTIFPTQFLGGFLGFVGKRDHLVRPDNLRRLVRRNTEFSDLCEAPIPLHVVATDLMSGAAQRFSEGSMVDAVLASSAIPAVFPPVTIDGRPYVDGGVVDNTPISQAIDLGATDIWVMPAGTFCGVDRAPTSSLGIALHSISMLINRRMLRDIAEFGSQVNLRVFPAQCPMDISPTDFDQSRRLIDLAYDSSSAWLDHELAHA